MLRCGSRGRLRCVRAHRRDASSPRRNRPRRASAAAGCGSELRIAEGLRFTLRFDALSVVRVSLFHSSFCFLSLLNGSGI
ncbi:hypothetical protein AXF42_Ash020183 [Apostasia shenzhenica]|uniref:Uncharacterized protein n=1 Tax=Apostasia shenzhenica TaxID=1088818 RepID=A0A2H9ZW04_9ASPA|nr:hypothetical protein AXF42_Ash020183 [Apostasia shenzhenica]